jgi:hypothetical protein
VKVTVPVVVLEVRVTPDCPPEQGAGSPPLAAVVLLSWQVRVTVPVYPANAATVTVVVADAPGVMAAGVVAERLKVDSLTVTVVVALA